LFEAPEDSSVRIWRSDISRYQDQWGKKTTLFTQEIIQAKFNGPLFAVLILTLEATKPWCIIISCTLTFHQLTLHMLHFRLFRVHSHAAVALINFREGIERATLVLYLSCTC
jgi:hypothetical protein